ncbi:MAG TPA: polysaccharide deacetylase family protein [Deltaproteobacteria bacterium]|nr:polysaccharide deacetylase family protein [Deltaproteobacteria bacterium]
MPDLILKVDVDTFRGMKEGVPLITRTLDEHGLRASFFISFGPDRSGLAVFQLLRPAFLKKMIRTNAPGLYGWKTALYGTVLKAPMIGLAFPDTIRDLLHKGHEVACHAWDHRLWQDWLFLMTRRSIETWFQKMVAAYIHVTGKKPKAFGAPSWMMDERSLAIAARFDLAYLSCTRARSPFIFAENGMLEIPSNLPCIEEVGAEGVMDSLKQRSSDPFPQVLPVHAEVEGMMCSEVFEQILNLAVRLGYRIRTLEEIALSLDRGTLPVRPLTMGLLPGRAFKCAV